MSQEKWTECPDEIEAPEALEALEGLPPGRKDDAGKDRWSLLPWDAVREVVKVLTFGAAKKYKPNNWQFVPDARIRYEDALERHLFAWRTGERLDPESGFNHLAHAGCCVLFLLWFDLRSSK